MLNQLNSASELSCTKATCRGHELRSRAGDMQVAQNYLHLQMGGGFNSANSFRAKRRCQLVVRLKANVCYQELLCFLSFYINLLKLLNLQRNCLLALAGSRPLALDPEL